jgi:hypothetical protein
MSKYIKIDPDKAERELARLRYRATAYEVSFEAPDGTEYLVCYSGRKTNQALCEMLARYKDRVCPLMDDTEGDLQRRTQWPAYKSPTWRFGFSGRTYRDALTEGRLPSIPAARES